MAITDIQELEKVIVNIEVGKGNLAQRMAWRKLQQILIRDVKNTPGASASTS
jgi:hypothetical protein